MKWEKMLLEEEFQSGKFDRDLNKLIKAEQWVIKRLRNLAEYQILYSKINYVFRQGGYVRNEQEWEIVNEIQSHELIKGQEHGSIETCRSHLLLCKRTLRHHQ